MIPYKKPIKNRNRTISNIENKTTVIQDLNCLIENIKNTDEKFRHFRPIDNLLITTNSSNTSSSKSSIKSYRLKYCSPVSSIIQSSTNSPLIYSRRSSLSSLNSFDVKSIHSSVASEYSYVPTPSSGLRTPANEVIYIIKQTNNSRYFDVDSFNNSKCNETTIIERTLQPESPIIEEEIVKKYDNEDILWDQKSISELSKPSCIVEELNEPLNDDLLAIYRLITLKNPQFQALKFTPPVKLDKSPPDSPPKCYYNEYSPSKQSTRSELSVPSVIKDDLESDFKNLPSSPIIYNSPNQSIRNETESSPSEDEIKLLEFISRMLPKSTKTNSINQINETPKQQQNDIAKKTPIVNMNRTTQLRLNKTKNLKNSQNINSTTKTRSSKTLKHK